MASAREELRRRMEAAAEAMDFEEAARLRDRLDRQAVEELGSVGIVRQQPGAMGLGTSDPKVRRPEGWTPPPRPDPMTAVVKGRKRKRR